VKITDFFFSTASAAPSLGLFWSLVVQQEWRRNLAQCRLGGFGADPSDGVIVAMIGFRSPPYCSCSSRKMEDGVKTGTKPKKSGFSTGESPEFTREI
jgi:hypothetical protein